MCDSCNCKDESKDLLEAIKDLIDNAVDDKLLQWKVELLEYINKRYEKRVI
jgi:hypothetical protein